MTDKLKSCPFCGGEAELIKGWCELDNYVMCLSCRVRTKPMNTKESAIKKWNTRKPMDRIVEQLEEKIKTIPHIQHWPDQEKCYVNAIEIIQAGGRND